MATNSNQTLRQKPVVKSFLEITRLSFRDVLHLSEAKGVVDGIPRKAIAGLEMKCAVCSQQIALVCVAARRTVPIAMGVDGAEL